MTSNSYDNTTGGWEKLLAAVQNSEAILPATEALQVALEWHLQEAKAAKARQELHRAGSQRATKDLRQQLAAGGDAAIRLRSLVKSALGPRDERLTLFGMTPIKQRIRKVRTSRNQQPSAGSGSSEPAK